MLDKTSRTSVRASPPSSAIKSVNLFAEKRDFRLVENNREKHETNKQETEKEKKHMRETTKKTRNYTKRMNVNAAVGLSLKDVNKQLKVNAAAMHIQTDNETGEVKYAGVLVDVDGTIYSFISKAVVDVMPDVIDIIEEEGEIDVRIDKRKSKDSEYEYLTLTIL